MPQLDSVSLPVCDIARFSDRKGLGEYVELGAALVQAMRRARAGVKVRPLTPSQDSNASEGEPNPLDLDWVSFHSGHGSVLLQYLVASLGSRGSGLLLDFGCGIGAKANELQKRGWNVVGIDISFGRLRMGSLVGFAFDKVLGDGACLPFRTGAFDVVVVTSVLTFCTNLVGSTDEIARILHLDGRALILEFDSSNPLVRRFRGWNSKYFITQSSLAKLLAPRFEISDFKSNVGLVPHRLFYLTHRFRGPRILLRLMFRLDEFLGSLPILKSAGMYFRIDGRRNNAP